MEASFYLAHCIRLVLFRKFENEDDLTRYIQGLFDSPNPEELNTSEICDLPWRWTKVINSSWKFK